MAGFAPRPGVLDESAGGGVLSAFMAQAQIGAILEVVFE